MADIIINQTGSTYEVLVDGVRIPRIRALTFKKAAGDVAQVTVEFLGTVELNRAPEA